MSYQAAINALTEARKDVVEYVKHAPEPSMQYVRELVTPRGCQGVFMGATLCIYAPGTVARFCIDLETMEVREVIEHK